MALGRNGTMEFLVTRLAGKSVSSHTYKNLVEEDGYVIKVAAYNNGGNGPYETVIVTTSGSGK